MVRGLMNDRPVSWIGEDTGDKEDSEMEKVCQWPV